MVQKGPIFFHANNPQYKTKKMSITKSNSVQWLGRYSCDTNANKKLENIENNSKMPYLSFISTRLDSKSG